MEKKKEQAKPLHPEVKPAEDIVPSSSDLELYKPVGLDKEQEPAFAEYYKSPVHLERQYIGVPPEEDPRQLEFADLFQDDTKTVEEYCLGLTDASIPEWNAVTALQVLLSETGYKGNLTPKQAYSSSFAFDGYLPRIRLEYKDYYRTYGLDKRGGQYQGKQVEEALQALRSLAEKTRYIYYERKRQEGKKKVTDLIKHTGKLIELDEAYVGLNDDELALARKGEDVPGKRHRYFVVTLSPLFVDQIETFFTLKHKHLYQELKALHPGKRIPASTIAFINLLGTIDLPEFRRKRNDLAYQLNLHKYIENRRQADIDRLIQEAIDDALALGYLLKYEKKATISKSITYYFWPNPERYSRVKKKQLQAGAKEEKSEKDSSITE
jgi:hypothetical protein